MSRGLLPAEQICKTFGQIANDARSSQVQFRAYTRNILLRSNYWLLNNNLQFNMNLGNIHMPVWILIYTKIIFRVALYHVTNVGLCATVTLVFWRLYCFIGFLFTSCIHKSKIQQNCNGILHFSLRKRCLWWQWAVLSRRHKDGSR